MSLITTKASFANISLEERQKFEKSICYLLVSVGQKQHEDIKLQATLELVTKRFKKCVVMLCDTLQRYNIIAEGFSVEDAYKTSLKRGDIWLKDNKNKCEEYGITDFFRWDYWLNHENFLSFKEKIMTAYENDEIYKQAINESAQEFCERAGRTMDHFISFSVDYLIEECAVMLIWANIGLNYEIYPSGRNKAMTKTYEKFILPYNNDIMKSVSIRFKKHTSRSSFLYEN